MPFAGFLAGKPVPEKSLITFDDGYLDNYVYAHPVLQRYGMHIIFLITGLIGNGPARPFNGQGVQLPATQSIVRPRRCSRRGDADSVMLRWSEVQAMREAEPSSSIAIRIPTHAGSRRHTARSVPGKDDP